MQKKDLLKKGWYNVRQAKDNILHYQDILNFKKDKELVHSINLDLTKASFKMKKLMKRAKETKNFFK